MSENHSRNTTKILACFAGIGNWLLLARESVPVCQCFGRKCGKRCKKADYQLDLMLEHGGSDPGKVGVQALWKGLFNLAVALKLEKEPKAARLIN